MVRVQFPSRSHGLWVCENGVVRNNGCARGLKKAAAVGYSWQSHRGLTRATIFSIFCSIIFMFCLCFFISNNGFFLEIYLIFLYIYFISYI